MPLRKERLRSQARPSCPAEAGLVQKAINRYTMCFHSGRAVYGPVTRSRNAESKATTLEEAHVHAACPRSSSLAHLGRMPALSRNEAASPCMPQMRIL